MPDIHVTISPQVISATVEQPQVRVVKLGVQGVPGPGMPNQIILLVSHVATATPPTTDVVCRNTYSPGNNGVWARNAAGIYTLTFFGVSFPGLVTGRTVVHNTSGDDPVLSPFILFGIQSASSFRLRTFNLAHTPADAGFNNVYLYITVFDPA